MQEFAAEKFQIRHVGPQETALAARDCNNGEVMKTRRRHDRCR
jgi:hypothetical protein